MLECSVGTMGISLFSTSYGKKWRGGKALHRAGLNAICFLLPSLTELPPVPAAYRGAVEGKNSHFSFTFTFCYQTDSSLEILKLGCGPATSWLQKTKLNPFAAPLPLQVTAVTLLWIYTCTTPQGLGPYLCTVFGGQSTSALWLD